MDLSPLFAPMITFAPGETSQLISVPIVDDGYVENDEYFLLTLSNAVAATLLVGQGSDRAVGTILDNEPTVTIDDSVWYEGYDSDHINAAAFTVSLSHTVSTTVTVGWHTTSSSTDATPGIDYVASSGTITFPPGYVEASRLVDFIDDNTPESPQDFYVALDIPSGANIGNQIGKITILDNDPGSGSGSGTGSSGSGSGSGGGAPVFKSRRIGGGEFPAEDLLTMKANEHYESGSPFEFKIINPPAYATPRIQIETGGGAEIADNAGTKLTKTFSVSTSVTRSVRYYNDANGNGDFDAGETSIVSATFVVQPVTVWEIDVRYVNTLPGVRPRDIRDVFKEATNLAIRKDDELDFRSAMKFKIHALDAFVPTGPAGARPAIADTQTKRDIYKNTHAGYRFTILEDLGEEPPGSILSGQTNWATFLITFGNHSLINWNNAAPSKAAVILHEFGHQKQLSHKPASTFPTGEADKYIMYKEGGKPRLRETEADQLD